MPLVNHEDLEEIGRQIMPPAQVIDHIAHTHVFGHGHEVAAHQAPGGFFGIGQRAFDCGAVFRIEFGQHRLLVLFVEILDQLDGIIGFELFGDESNSLCRQRLHHVFANIIVEFGNHFRAHQVGDRARQRGPVIAVEQLEQIGDIGRVERLYQVVDRALVAFIKRIAHATDIFGLEPVFLVVALVIDAVVRVRAFLFRRIGQQKVLILVKAHVFGHAHGLGSGA